MPMIGLASPSVGARSLKIIVKEVHERDFCKAILTKYDASKAIFPEIKIRYQFQDRFHTMDMKDSYQFSNHIF